MLCLFYKVFRFEKFLSSRSFLAPVVPLRRLTPCYGIWQRVSWYSTVQCSLDTIPSWSCCDRSNPTRFPCPFRGSLSCPSLDRSRIDGHRICFGTELFTCGSGLHKFWNGFSASNVFNSCDHTPHLLVMIETVCEMSYRTAFSLIRFFVEKRLPIVTFSPTFWESLIAVWSFTNFCAPALLLKIIWPFKIDINSFSGF